MLLVFQDFFFGQECETLILPSDQITKDSKIKENAVRDFGGIEKLEYIKESSIDWTCNLELERNYWAYEEIKKRTTKEDIIKWSKALIGFRPNVTDIEPYDEWILENAWRRKQLRPLNEFIKSVVKYLKISRALVVCIIRELQKDCGTRINFNFFKDGALKELFKVY